jgi:hypothetical protein
MPIEAKFPTDAIAVSDYRRVLSSGTKPVNYVNSHYAGITSSNSITSLTNNEDASFILNAATQGAEAWIRAGGDKDKFEREISADKFGLRFREGVLSVVGAGSAAEMLKAYKVNFYRGAETMRNTPSGNGVDGKKNILHNLKRGGYFRTMDNKPAPDDLVNGLKLLPVGINQARQGLRASGIKVNGEATNIAQNDNAQRSVRM